MGAWGRIEAHLVAGRPRPAVLVGSHLTVRLGLIAERALANEETALFLTELTAEGLFPQIGKGQLVEHPAKLNREDRIVVGAVETVRHRDHTDTRVLEDPPTSGGAFPISRSSV